MKSLMLISLLLSFSIGAEEVMTVFKSPTCGCCTKWINHMKDNGFTIKEVNVSDMESIKVRYAIPKGKRSCHTAIYKNEVFEGHIPASSVKKYLNNKKEMTQFKGLTVPNMPMGSPGMEYGEHKEKFTVFKFDNKGNVAEFEKF